MIEKLMIDPFVPIRGGWICQLALCLNDDNFSRFVSIEHI
jgi:hypothetical protein